MRRAALAAVTFLTRVPVARGVALDGGDVARGTVLFPVVGAMIGAASGGVAVLLAHRLGTPLAAVSGVAAEALITGALHLDALADAADGLGGRTREDALRIMRDHAVGAYGAIALLLDVLLRAAATAALLGRAHAALVLAAAAALSRAAPLPLAALLPYARGTSGTGEAVTAHAGPWRAAAASVLALAIAVAVCGVRGAIMAAAVGVCAAAAGWGWHRRLGGVTGDCLGATTEIAQIVALLVAVAW